MKQIIFNILVKTNYQAKHCKLLVELYGFIEKDSKMKVMNSYQHKLKPKIIIKDDIKVMGLGEGAQLSKCLMHEYEGWSLDTQDPCERWHDGEHLEPRTGQRYRDSNIPRTHWQASLAK